MSAPLKSQGLCCSIDFCNSQHPKQKVRTTPTIKKAKDDKYKTKKIPKSEPAAMFVSKIVLPLFW